VRISATYTPTVRLLFSATNQIRWVTRANLVLYGFFSGVPVLLLLYHWFTGKLGTEQLLGLPSWAVLAAIAVFAPIFFNWLSYRQIAANLKSNPSANGPQTLNFSETGVEVIGDGADVSVDWKNIVRVCERGAFLLAFFSKDCAYVVPKQLLSEAEIDQIKAWYSAAA